MKPECPQRDQATTAALAKHEQHVVRCQRCPRLVAWRSHIARIKRAAYSSETYWGQPVPGFGDTSARILIIGLAPAAHGANRTGRVFTGDRSGDFLFGALHRAGLANQPTSSHSGDGLHLHDVFVTSVVRCAPPGNKPTAHERENCRPFLETEFDLLPTARVLLALGAYAWNQILRIHRARSPHLHPSNMFRFTHSAEVAIGTRTLLASYHPSQQNTFTGRLTTDMIDGVIGRACELARKTDL